jgi:HK97 family phage portal protein
VTDLVLTGDAFALIGTAGADPAALIRMHPERVKVTPSPDGQPGSYMYDVGGKATRYEYGQVLHIRMPSWEDTPSGLYGTGAIRSLANDLTTDLRAQKMASATAETGRPTGVFSPSDPSDRWSSAQVKVLREAYEKQMSGVSGALFLGGPVKYDALGFSPRDMEYQATRTWVRDAVLAAIGVVPTRIGIPSANYATAAQSARRYWEDLQSRAALIDSELTRLARMFPDSEGVRVVHSFDDVAALQESRTERVARVNSWWMMGIPLADAAAMEGFDDLPVPDVDDEEAVGPVGLPSDSQPVSAQALNGAQIGSLLEILAAVAAGGLTVDAAVALIGVAFPTITEEDARDIVAGARAIPVTTEPAQVTAHLRTILSAHGVIDCNPLAKWLVLEGGELYQAPKTEAARAELWRGFIDNVQGPAERNNALAMRKYLRGYAARVAKRTAQHEGQLKSMVDGVEVRGLTDAILDKILDPAVEAKMLLNIFRPLFRKMIRAAIKAAGKLLPVATTFDPVRINAQVERDIGAMITRVSDTTREQVGKTVRAGLADGLSMNELQANLMRSASFTPARALMIARTETTRAIGAGAKVAIEDARSKGVKVKEEWVSARDENVREAHQKLDGQKIDKGEQFEIDGKTAEFPGGFGDPGLDINCRCGTVPFVMGVS